MYDNHNPIENDQQLHDAKEKVLEIQKLILNIYKNRTEDMDKKSFDSVVNGFKRRIDLIEGQITKYIKGI